MSDTYIQAWKGGGGGRKEATTDWSTDVTRFLSDYDDCKSYVF